MALYTKLCLYEFLVYFVIIIGYKNNLQYTFLYVTMSVSYITANLYGICLSTCLMFILSRCSTDLR